MSKRFSHCVVVFLDAKSAKKIMTAKAMKKRGKRWPSSFVSCYATPAKAKSAATKYRRLGARRVKIEPYR